MRIVQFFVLMMTARVLAGGGGGKHHVHLRIHVPELIKHQHHTKTIVIHTYPKKMTPKKKKPHHVESHQENWSSWSSYESSGGHDTGNSEDHGHKNNVDSKDFGKYSAQAHGMGAENVQGHSEDHAPWGYNREIPSYGDQASRDPHYHDVDSQYYGKPSHANYGEQYQGHNGGGYFDEGHGGAVGYSYPPQYGSHESAKNFGDQREIPVHEDEAFKDHFEEGYARGLHRQTGHKILQDSNKFFDDHFEEDGHAAQGYDEDSRYKDNLHGKLEDETDHAADENGDKENYGFHADSNYLGSAVKRRRHRYRSQ